jgi:hypothetical protein
MQKIRGTKQRLRSLFFLHCRSKNQLRVQPVAAAKLRWRIPQLQPNVGFSRPMTKVQIRSNKKPAEAGFLLKPSGNSELT